MIRRPPRSTLFPYTTLFRSQTQTMTDLAHKVGEITLWNRAGGAPSLAVGMAQIFSSTIGGERLLRDRKSTRLNSSHLVISYAVFCLKKKNEFYQRYATSVFS